MKLTTMLAAGAVAGLMALGTTGCDKAADKGAKATAVKPADKVAKEAAEAKKAAEAKVAEATKKAEAAKKAAADKANAGAKTAAAGKGEVTFDPRKPPAGFTKCHRNHCHREGGGVASYAQVMKEIGATKLVGVPKKKAMPAAPKDVAAPPADAKKTASGLATKVLTAAKADAKKPGPTSVVTVHYTGWTTDGKAFDSSVSRGAPATFPLNRVIAGWTEGLQLMSVGEERRLWIPENLAYKGSPGKPAGMLVFDVELLSIK